MVRTDFAKSSPLILPPQKILDLPTVLDRIAKDESSVAPILIESLLELLSLDVEAHVGIAVRRGRHRQGGTY